MVTITIINEDGDEKGFQVEMPSAILPEEDDDSYNCLRFVDLYGDTVFNRLQMPVLLSEIARREHVVGDQYPDVIAKLRHLCQEVMRSRQLYLKFVGD